MEQVNNVAKCPFCQGEFKIEKDDIKIEHFRSDYGYYYVYKTIKCPVCNEYIAKECFGTVPRI